MKQAENGRPTRNQWVTVNTNTFVKLLLKQEQCAARFVTNVNKIAGHIVTKYKNKLT
jgi:hypothetical protein